MTKANLTWTNGQARLGDLIEYEKNPVQLSERAAKHLAAQMKRGQDLPYVIAAPLNGHKKYPLLDGHQRKAVELSINNADPNKLVRIIYPSRALTDREKQQWIIEHRKNTGEFDFDILANSFDIPDLLDWGFDQNDLLDVDYKNPKLIEHEEDLKSKKFLRVLISIPVDSALQGKKIIQELEKTISDIEIIYGAN